MSLRRHVPLLLAACAVLLSFARWFDFQCDDAFIAFRYAQNWVDHGQIVYNLGERVEGYTSFTWVCLLAALHRAGIALPIAARILGATSSVLLLVMTARLASRLFPARPLALATLLSLVACNASVAAWTLGGLETPLFSALVVGSIVALHDWISRATPLRAIVTLAWVSLASLTRPEGAILFIALCIGVAVSAWKRLRAPRGTALFVSSYLGVLIGYVLWRHSYYGEFLPNTYYVKTTGEPRELWARGISYLGFYAKEQCPIFVGLVLGLALIPRRSRVPRSARNATELATLLASHTYVLATLLFIASVGGDFLDLYRFVVPILPLVFAYAIRNLLKLRRTWRFARKFPSAQVVFVTAGLVWYGWNQFVLAQSATQLTEAGRRQHEIEPLGWTRMYARRWAALGRWIAEHQAPGDVLAVGAAGAMPFFAGIPNIDTLGLCDRTVAREGVVLGSRPGHQRFATHAYLLRRAPTFLLIGDYTAERPVPFRHDPRRELPGYTWIEAQLTPERHGAPSAFVHHFQVRADRAEQLRNTPDTRVDGS